MNTSTLSLQVRLSNEQSKLRANLEAVLSETSNGGHKHVSIDAETPADKVLKLLDEFIMVSVVSVGFLYPSCVPLSLVNSSPLVPKKATCTGLCTQVSQNAGRYQGEIRLAGNEYPSSHRLSEAPTVCVGSNI